MYGNNQSHSDASKVFYTCRREIGKIIDGDLQNRVRKVTHDILEIPSICFDGESSTDFPLGSHGSAMACDPPITLPNRNVSFERRMSSGMIQEWVATNLRDVDHYRGASASIYCRQIVIVTIGWRLVVVVIVIVVVAVLTTSRFRFCPSVDVMRDLRSW